MSAKLARLTRARRYAVDPLSPLQTPLGGQPKDARFVPVALPKLSVEARSTALVYSLAWRKDEVSQA